MRNARGQLVSRGRRARRRRYAPLARATANNRLYVGIVNVQHHRRRIPSGRVVPVVRHERHQLLAEEAERNWTAARDQARLEKAERSARYTRRRPPRTRTSSSWTARSLRYATFFNSSRDFTPRAIRRIVLHARLNSQRIERSKGHFREGSRPLLLPRPRGRGDDCGARRYG
jgi:hypothetical protein